MSAKRCVTCGRSDDDEDEWFAEGQADGERRAQRAADELARLRKSNAELRKGFERACQTVYDEIEPECGRSMAQRAYHAVKTELRIALANAEKEDV